MYRYQNPKQLKMDIPFGVALDENNDWVRLSKMVPWDYIDDLYRKNFTSEDGQVAKPSRLAFGALYIKRHEGFTDEQTRKNIQENPYLQYFCGFDRYTMLSPFDQSLMTYFRKRLPDEVIDEIIAFTFKDDALSLPDVIKEETVEETSSESETKHSAGNGRNVSCDDTIMSSESSSSEETSEPVALASEAAPKNRGTLILDGTCIPADIHYPTDVNLLNHAREIAEDIIDTLYEPNKYLFDHKPRTYRESARKEYVAYSKQRKHSAKVTRKCIHRSLLYLKRDLGHIEAMVEKGCKLSLLSKDLYRKLLVIQELHRQQWEMYNNRTNRVADRIVSIAQPHIRPIVRGKAGAPTEFGAKIEVGLVGGYAFVISGRWDNFPEDKQLIPATEEFRRIFGFYPETILGDRAYPTNENRKWCNENGIRLSGSRRGRKSNQEKEEESRQIYLDSCNRMPIEGTFGVCKRRYGLDRVLTKLPDTSMTDIRMGFFVANMERKLRLLFAPIFFWWIDYGCQEKSLALYYTPLTETACAAIQ